MELVHVTTRKHTEFIDITHRLEALVDQSGVVEGIVNIQTLHTTTAVVINEHEPLLFTDAEAMLERLVPGAGGYHHDDFHRRTVNLMPGERANGHAHCRALLLAPTLGVNVAGGRLVLGRWQRVLFVELDGPRDRSLSVVLVPARLATDVHDHSRGSWIERRFSEALDRSTPLGTRR
jgi:secondary thiamine-phosphate synthase enzyme